MDSTTILHSEAYNTVFASVDCSVRLNPSKYTTKSFIHFYIVLEACRLPDTYLVFCYINAIGHNRVNVERLTQRILITF